MATLALNKQVAKELNGTGIFGQMVTMRNDGTAWVRANTEAYKSSPIGEVRDVLVDAGYEVRTSGNGNALVVGR